MKKPCILIMAGGTGGHVFPALAVAHQMQKNGWEVHWLGTTTGLEAKIMPQNPIPIHYITVRGLRRRGFLGWCLAPFTVTRALWQSIRIIHRVKPQVVLGMGGFISGPGGLAAWLLRCPLVIHEQNAIVGFTNRWLALVAAEILEAFPGAFKGGRATCIGNPVREALLNLPPPRDRFHHRNGLVRLLILGGSQGALALNELCPEAIQQLPKGERPEIWHQAGAGREIATAKAYEAAGIAARVEPFINDMASAYAWADVVLCRAGALTVSELAAAGVGSILVPFPFAVDDHQTYNGRFLEKAGAALLIAQSDLNPHKLADTLGELLTDRERLVKMAEAAYTIAKRDAVTKMTKICGEISKHAL